jgi:ankyrin repeat protein
VEALLDQGAPVDAADADGDTALMQSILADHPAAAAALRRRGASLDRQNHAGESGRSMATARDDAALNQALGLAP